MSEMFSEDFMNGFKDRWNADGELAGALKKSDLIQSSAMELMVKTIPAVYLA